VGAIENHPICKTGLDFELEDLNHIVQSFLPPGVSYTETSQICVNTLYGGSHYGNLGGVCIHDSNGLATLNYPEEFKDPKFTTAYYPSPPSLRMMSALRSLEGFCNSNCWCPNDREQKILLSSIRTSRLDRLVQRFRNFPSKMSRVIQRKHRRPGPESGSESGAGAGAGGSSITTHQSEYPYCHLSPSVKTHSNTKLETIDPQICSNEECLGVESCGPECKCAVKGTVDPAHFDYWGFVGACAAASLLWPQPKLGGRRDFDAEYCACNATYISGACCDSLDGLIWEAPEMKIGELRRREEEER
jgi:hypothetical protein